METRKLMGLIILSVVSITGMYFFTESPENHVSNDKMVVAVSIMPQKEFIDAIAGDRVDVVVMIPPGADPHTYEPEPDKLRMLEGARAYFIVGSGIEFETQYMDEMRSINPDMKIINTSEGIRFIKNSEGDLESPYDPHVWTSPLNAMVMVENTCQGLSELDPENRVYYRKRASVYLGKLDEIHKEIRAALKDRKGESLLVYHPAWGYFCEEYGLRQVAIERGGKEPGPRTMAEIIEKARRENVKVIIISPQFSTANANVIAREIGAELVVVDPLEGHYLENMKKLVEALEDGGV